MDDSPKGIFIRESAFCLIKTALFCIVYVLCNIIILLIAVGVSFIRLRTTAFMVYFAFSLFVTVSALVFFLIGRHLLAFDEESPKDYVVPAMIFIVGSAAIIIFRDPMAMFIMMSWNSFLQWFIHSMGGPDLLATPVLIEVWFVCCCIMTAGIRFKRFRMRIK